MLGAFDTPHDVERIGGKLDLLRIGAEKLRLIVDLMPVGGARSPTALKRTDRDADGVATAGLRQVNRRAAHAATDVEDFLAAGDACEVGKPLGQLDLSASRRFVGGPEAMMDVRSPEQAIEQGRQIVVTLDAAFLNF